MKMKGPVNSFKLNREMDDYERTHPLWSDREQQFSPDESLALIRFNSTFIEFVDRGFRQRGMPVAWVAAALTGLIFLSLLIFVWLFGDMWIGESSLFGRFVIIFLIIVSYTLFPVVMGMAYRAMRDSFWGYIYYPIRFNRKNRKVYFFLHNDPGGVVSVDWDDPNVYFHVGRGEGIKYLRDLRCHVLDGYTVKQTFAIGHYWSHQNYIREEWEYIRRYMELGPDQVVDHPADLGISLSVEPSWENCVRHAYWMGPMDFIAIGRLLYPFYAVIAAGRWLAMKTCKKPVWPAEVEAECRIAADDEWQLIEPRISGELDDEVRMKRAEERMHQRKRWEKDVL